MGPARDGRKDGRVGTAPTARSAFAREAVPSLRALSPAKAEVPTGSDPPRRRDCPTRARRRGTATRRGCPDANRPSIVPAARSSGPGRAPWRTRAIRPRRRQSGWRRSRRLPRWSRPAPGRPGGARGSACREARRAEPAERPCSARRSGRGSGELRVASRPVATADRSRPRRRPGTVPPRPAPDRSEPLRFDSVVSGGHVPRRTTSAGRRAPGSGEQGFDVPGVADLGHVGQVVRPIQVWGEVRFQLP